MEDAASREALQSPAQVGRRRRPFVLRYLQPKLAAALVLWRAEAHTATPLAVLLVATLGRWPGALVMGSVMAVFAALFLYLLDGEAALEDTRAWAASRRIGRFLERLAAREDRWGKAWKVLAIVPAVMLLGPFWRAVAFHSFRMPRPLAYPIAVGGSIPHSLLWTGVVVGGIWEGIVWPWIKGL